uniref:Uncharacterized protein n=1 Tax=Helianthus annuus TaxID=4232 RepID=A0A251UX97_HELAN
MKEDIVSFLKRRKSTFAWKHEDMTGISKDIITHKLGIDRSLNQSIKKGGICTRKKCHYPGRGRKITTSRSSIQDGWPMWLLFKRKMESGGYVSILLV